MKAIVRNIGIASLALALGLVGLQDKAEARVIIGVQAGAVYFDNVGYPIWGYDQYGRPIYAYDPYGIAICTPQYIYAGCRVPGWRPATHYSGPYYWGCYGIAQSHWRPAYAPPQHHRPVPLPSHRPVPAPVHRPMPRPSHEPARPPSHGGGGGFRR